MVKKFFDIRIDNSGGEARLILIDKFKGGKGILKNSNSALIRPYKHYLEDKTKLGLIKYVLIHEDDDYYVLGTFVRTSIGRILFFPGLINREVQKSIGNGYNKKTKEDVDTLGQKVDHHTLKPNLKSCHLKFDNRNIEFKNQQTSKITNSLFLWTHYQISSFKEFELLPEFMKISLKIPSNPLELVSILPDIRDSRDNVIDVIKFTEKSDHPFFLTLQIFVSPNREQNLDGILARIEDSPSFVVVPKKQDRVNAKLKKITLDGFDGCIWVVVYKVSGHLTIGHFMMSGEKMQKKHILPNKMISKSQLT